MTIIFEKMSYQGWTNCHRLANSLVDLVITGDVGPRIIRFGFVGEGNEFAEFADQMGKTGGSEWRPYGGHRLWHAPEVNPRTYYPDNQSVTVTQRGDLVHIAQAVEPTTGIGKEIEIALSPDSAHVRLVHRLTNHNLWAVECAPWALSVMAAGGVAIVPLPARGAHPEQLQPTSTLTLWAYTDMTDPRWTWGRQYILLRQDPNASIPQKVGASVLDGWTAYARDGHLFIKLTRYQPTESYPDFGASVEVFTNTAMLELETLGPLARLAPGESVEHVEDWFLRRDVAMPTNDADVDQAVLPAVLLAQNT